MRWDVWYLQKWDDMIIQRGFWLSKLHKRLKVNKYFTALVAGVQLDVPPRGGAGGGRQLPRQIMGVCGRAL